MSRGINVVEPISQYIAAEPFTDLFYWCNTNKVSTNTAMVSANPRFLTFGAYFYNQFNLDNAVEFYTALFDWCNTN